MENKSYYKRKSSLNFLKEKVDLGGKNVNENNRKTYAALKVIIILHVCLHTMQHKCIMFLCVIFYINLVWNISFDR